MNETDNRRDAGEFYPGGRNRTRIIVEHHGDVSKSDFAGVNVKTNTIPDLRAAVKELGRRLGATVVTAFAACVAIGATVETAPLNGFDFDSDPQVVTNVTFEGLATAADIDLAVTNLDARPVPITPLSSGRGVTFVDQYGEDQNVAVAIGAGAEAAVTTNAVEAAADNKVIRSTGVAIGGHASVENSADPLKIQGVAVGWHATVTAINGVAVGGGASHPGDNDATTASAPKAIAIGYNAKASAADAVQLGEGENTEAGTLKYRNVTVVKDGKVVANPAVTNALARHEAEIDAIKTDYAQLYFAESNGVKRVTIQNDEHTFRVITDTNRADGVALTMGDAEIYGTAAIDRALADKADVDYVLRNFANLQIIAWPYSSANTYNKGDYCIHDYGTTAKALCRCKVDNTTGYWYSENWDIVRLADQTVLKSIHSETPEFGKWTISQNPNYGVPIYGLYYAPIGAEYGEAGLPSADTEVWWFDMTGAREGIWTTETNSAATSASCVLPLAFPGYTEYVTLTGTRTITYPVIAYQLGSNSDKLLQPKGDYARVGDITNTVTKAYVDSLGITSEETDPTVPQWAKTQTKPTYTASEVGAASSNKVEEVRQDNAQTRQIVTTWENFLDGSNVVFSITNYLSGAYNLDAAKLRILELRNGEYHEVYNSRDEILLHIDDFSNRCFRVALDAIVDEVAARLASKADKDWGKYTSAGGDAPSNTVYMTAPNTVFAGGLEYERVAVGEGSICVLTTKGAPTWTQGDEGTFKFQDDGGTNYFGFAKTDSYTIGAKTDGITVQGGMVTMQYNITMSGRPCVWYKSTLSPSAEWEQLNLPDGSPVSGATYAVSWEQNPTPGTQVCYLNVGNSPQGFFRATVEVAGEAKFMTNMPADLSGGIISTNTATGVNGVVKPTFNGSSVIWNWSAK